MLRSITAAAISAASILSLTASVDAQNYQGCFSTASPMFTNETLSWTYQSTGWCREHCEIEYTAFALTNGSTCYCGDKPPSESAKVSDDECNVKCQGFPTETCGGQDTFSVFTIGSQSSVENASDDEVPAGIPAKPTKGANQSPTLIQSTVTQAGQTIVVTATSTSQDDQSAPKASGPNKGAIAAGVVVGILVVAGVAAGAFFFVRHRRRREIEEDHQRQQAIGRFGGTIKSEHSSADSRLDPTVLYRRQSDGSIADERDLSRRVLKVTNPDRNTMVA